MNEEEDVRENPFQGEADHFAQGAQHPLVRGFLKDIGIDPDDPDAVRGYI